MDDKLSKLCKKTMTQHATYHIFLLIILPMTVLIEMLSRLAPAMTWNGERE